MTRDEQSAVRHVGDAKGSVKEAFAILDPAPMDPAAQAILRALDSIDRSIQSNKSRDRI
jgi:hypothetical protein